MNTVYISGKVAFFVAENSTQLILPRQLPILNREKFVNIAKRVEMLFTSLPEGRERVLISSQYKHHLQLQGLCSAKGRLDNLKITEAFIKFYGLAFLTMVKAPITWHQSHWLNILCHVSRSFVHPLLDILFSIYLESDERERTDDKYFSHQRVLDEGSWLCLNIACDYYQQFSIKTRLTYYFRKCRRIELFLCSCGYEYTKTGFDTNKYLIRVKHFGDVWDTYLTKLSGEKLSIAKISTILHIGFRTVQHQMLRLGLMPPIQAEDVRFHIAQQTLEKKRTILEKQRMKFIAIRRDNPNDSIESLKEKDESIRATSNFLKRKDRVWYDEHKPHATISLQSVKTKAAHQEARKIRDKTMAEQVVLAAMHIKSQSGFPIRVTRTAIHIRLGFKIAAIIPNDMPETRKAFVKVLESRGEFFLRKLQWSERYMRREGLVINKRNLSKYAHISFTTAQKPQVKNLILSFMN